MDAAIRCGYSSVDLRLAPATSTDIVYPMFGDTGMRREVLSRMRDTGISVYDVEIIRLMRDTVATEYEQLFEAAAALGAKRIKVVGIESDEGLMTDKFVEVCRLAAPYGLTIDIEFVSFLGVRSLEGALRVVRSAAQTNGSLLVDALHLSRSGGGPADVAALRGGDMGYIQLCDAVPAVPVDDQGKMLEARGCRLAPGEGVLPLTALVRAVPAHFPISLEVPMAGGLMPVERAKRAIDGLKMVMAEANE